MSTRKKKHSVFTEAHFNSGNGMLTTVWGPSMWHCLHTISFNYPVEPTAENKEQYRDFILSLRNVLPCGKCRKNLYKNFKKLPLKMENMENRDTFSKYIYDLHELINTMLHKKSGLTYAEVKQRYENFRARCKPEATDKKPEATDKKPEATDKKQELTGKKNKTMKRHTSSKKEKTKKVAKVAKVAKKENGCTEPIKGEKSKCVLHIVPDKTKCETFQIDRKCLAKKA